MGNTFQKSILFACIILMYTNYIVFQRYILLKKILLKGGREELWKWRESHLEQDIAKKTLGYHSYGDIIQTTIATNATETKENSRSRMTELNDATTVMSQTTEVMTTAGCEPEIVQLQTLEKCTLNFTCTNKEDKSQWFNYTKTPKPLDVVMKVHSDMQVGGVWTPIDCQNNVTSPHRTAIILPYRDREQHLSLFLENIIHFLKIQKQSFQIFVIEQVGLQIFNRAFLMNIGFLETLKMANFTCFIFHDVDMVPVNLCNFYQCSETGVRHLGISRDLENPRMFWHGGLSAATAFTKKQYQQINGFTNIMFGWGGEDDEGYERVKLENIPLKRYEPYIGNYYHLDHDRNEKGNPVSRRRESESYSNAQYRKKDGLNTATYKIHSIQRDFLYTKIKASFLGPVQKKDTLAYFRKKTLQLLRYGWE